jgi:hypothetical protein
MPSIQASGTFLSSDYEFYIMEPQPSQAVTISFPDVDYSWFSHGFYALDGKNITITKLGEEEPKHPVEIY